jgi:hypothetical protein
MMEVSPIATPAEALHSTLGRHGWTVTGVPTDATADQVSAVVSGLLRELTRLSNPDVAEALDRGDLEAAARLMG